MHQQRWTSAALAAALLGCGGIPDTKATGSVKGHAFAHPQALYKENSDKTGLGGTVLVLDADGRQVVHTVHGPGMTVGEPGYFSVERDRSVSNVAVTPAILIRLDRAAAGPR